MIAAFTVLKYLNNISVWRSHFMGKSNPQLLNAVRNFLPFRPGRKIAYSELQYSKVNRDFGFDVEATSFDDSTVSEWTFGKVPVKQKNISLNLIFVGRFQSGKKLETLIDLALRSPSVCVRLIGPEMEKLSIPSELYKTGRVACYEKVSGEDLDAHFDWADLVAGPGDAGLLVMNAARHRKGIMVDANNLHAPEYWLAQESNQPFVNFLDDNAVHAFVSSVLDDPDIINEWGESLREMARKRYTDEYMEAARMHFLGYPR